MSRARCLCLLTAAALLAGAAPARSDAPWTEPLSLDAPGAYRLRLAVGDSGRAVALWLANGRMVIATREPGGAIRPTTSLEVAHETLARSGPESILVVARGTVPRRRLLRAFEIGTDGRVLGRSLLTAHYAYDATTDVNGRGAAVVAWVARDGSIRARMRSAARRPFGPAVTVAPPATYPHDLGTAVSRAGEVVVAWAEKLDSRRRVLLRAQPARSDAFGPVTALGHHAGVAVVQAAFSEDRLHVAWSTQDGGEEADRPVDVHVTSRAPRSGRFARDRILHSSAAPGQFGFSLGLVPLPGGGAAVAWSSPVSAAVASVLVAIAGSDGRFGAVQRLDADGLLSDLGASPRGELVVTWTRPSGVDVDESSWRAVAAVRPAGGAFGAPEIVSGPGGTDPEVAVGAGRATAVWQVGTRELQVSDRAL